MDATTEKLVQHRDRWVVMAMQAPRKAIRAHRLSVAHLHEVDAELTKRAFDNIAQSKGLIAKAATTYCAATKIP